jgi:hypothetical protein
MRDRWRHKDMCISMGYSAQSPSSTPKSTKRKMEATLSLQRVKVGVRLTRHKLDSHQDESSLWYAASWARARGLLESSFASLENYFLYLDKYTSHSQKQKVRWRLQLTWIYYTYSYTWGRVVSHSHYDLVRKCMEEVSNVYFMEQCWQPLQHF